MTNNFELYKEYITKDFENNTLPAGDMYFAIELIRRGKDNPNLPAANYHFKNYYIRKPEDLDKYKQEIIDLCCLFKLRAYASINYKSFKQVSLNTMAELARRISTNDFNKSYNVFESCSGAYCNSSNKRWIIDLDDCNISGDTVNTCLEILSSIEPIGDDKIIAKFPTKSGVHIITKPFDRIKFNDPKYQYLIGQIPDIKKNHLTLLYENI